MGQALYRKYRSRSFDEVVGQDHVVKTLQNAVKSGRVSHAYLFTGPRGVGKTSVARLLAHEVNDLEYSGEEVHLDIIEIDAASNRRIDEIRDLRERVHIAPTSAKYKVYIIDEVHMLTREAFNALLKTLEEPPAHCIFILATTEAHKLPDTIVSRTQRFAFKPIESRSAVSHLQKLAKKEKIDISEPALELLAEHGNGSFRDSISLLDQLAAMDGKVDEQRVREVLGLPPRASIEKLLKLIANGDNAGSLGLLDELKERGASAALIAKDLAAELRSQAAAGNIEPWGLKLMKELVVVTAGNDPQSRLELGVLEAAYANRAAAPVKHDPPDPKTPSAPKDQAKDVSAPPATTPPGLATKARASGFTLEQWPQIVETAKEQAASIYTALRLAEPRLADDGLTLAFQFPLHQKKINQAKSLELVGRLVEETCGTKLAVHCVVDKKLQVSLPKLVKEDTQSPAADPSLQAISNIFGPAEVLES